MTTKNGKAIARSKHLKEEVATHQKEFAELAGTQSGIGAPSTANSPSTEECPTDEAAAVDTDEEAPGFNTDVEVPQVQTVERVVQG